TFLMMIMAFIPTPGAGGAAEGGFFVIFKTFFAVNEIKMAILFWRIYTFYLPILVGGLFLILKHRKNN
ncbi:MAG: lysylphosphatidylglycerol synthase domain-containing protein, partial [Clostridia bacterium]